MSEAKPLSAEEERWLRESVERSLATPNGDFALYSASRMAQVLATLDAERAKVEAAEARATAAEAEAERMREASAKAPGLRAGGWWYPEDQTDEGHCHFSPEEVVSDFYEPEPGDHVFALDRALSLPTVYAAVRVFTEAEKDARQDDEPFVMTLHATPDEACAALAKEKPDAGE